MFFYLRSNLVHLNPVNTIIITGYCISQFICMFSKQSTYILLQL